MATQAANFPATGVAAGVDGLNDVAVAAAAGVLGYVAAGRGDLDVIGKVAVVK